MINWSDLEIKRSKVKVIERTNALFRWIHADSLSSRTIWFRLLVNMKSCCALSLSSFWYVWHQSVRCDICFMSTMNVFRVILYICLEARHSNLCNRKWCTTFGKSYLLAFISPHSLMHRVFWSLPCYTLINVIRDEYCFTSHMCICKEKDSACLRLSSCSFYLCA